MPERFADKALREFYNEFMAHCAREEEDREAGKRQWDEIHDALFRKENKDENVSPGVVQLLIQVSKRLEEIERTASRQKTFMGGVIFCFSAMWLFFTESAHKLIAFLKML